MGDFLAEFGRYIGGNPALAFPLALLAGLVSAFSPCVLASVPLVVGYVGGYADDRRRSVRYTLVFCFGLAATFTALGVLAAILGRMMTGVGKWFYLILGGIAALIGLWLLGAFGPGGGSSCRLPKLRGGVWGALILGAVAGVISSPCATPPLAVILAFVTGRANLTYGILLLVFYAIGHCALVLMAGTSLGFVQRLVDSPNMAKAGKAI
ncbi:MAG: cytochrome c biogenesis CcdA family protein [Bacteroidota bacterium]